MKHPLFLEHNYGDYQDAQTANQNLRSLHVLSLYH